MFKNWDRGYSNAFLLIALAICIVGMICIKFLNLDQLKVTTLVWSMCGAVMVVMSLLKNKYIKFKLNKKERQMK